ncbi:MAG: metalloregulator ArsR/SmtB family transcription factor [Spirosomaceae bacterium]|jgi:DNA-binding transcriptional ArsR family regulator|nr:metalloregulator ArsR/SmtB family transcription factor [Spirosomataceae bacterium]
MENQENSCIRVFADQVQINACKEDIKSAESSFSSLAQVLSLAGNEVRLKILYLLDQENELCPCDISDILEMSVPAISQHLRKLKDVNIIQFRKVGQTIFYSLKSNHLGIIKPLFQHINQIEIEQ